MTLKDLRELSDKVKEVSDFIFSLGEKENTLDEKMALLSLNTKINIIDSKILMLMKEKLD